MDAAANTRKVISFLVWAHTKYQKNTKRKKSKKEKEFVFSSLGQNVRLLSLPHS